MTKADAVKPPSSKVETVSLKVFIHCEGCRRKVKKIINGLDGVQAITIDSDTGKVTVIGTVDSKTLVQRLQKAGKHAEPWANAPAAGDKSGNQQNQQKAANNNKNKNKDDKSDKSEKEESADGESEVENVTEGTGKGGEGGGSGNNVSGGKGGGAKKKKSGAGAEATGGADVNESNANKVIANKNMASDSVHIGYSLQSAEYATHMFSDENANNCHIM